jgi:replicative DNA helicase
MRPLNTCVTDRSVANDATPPFRSAPHNIEAEQALLGAILVNNEAHDRVSDFLRPEHFDDPLHQQIYDHVAKMITSGTKATPITLRTFFEKSEPINASQTVPQYLVWLFANAATIINDRDYARTIHDHAIRRQLILIGEDMVNVAFDSPVDFPPKEQIEAAEAALFKLVEVGPNEQEILTAYQAMKVAIDEVDAAHKNGTGIIGLATGIRSLDLKIGGLRPGQLTIIGGRTSMGKTALATCIAASIGRSKRSVYFVTMEMRAADVVLRILSAAVGASAFNLGRGVGVEKSIAGLIEEHARWLGLPFRLDQSGALSIHQLRARVRRAHRKQAIELLVVDYLQLMKGGAYHGRNRVEEVGEISNGLKALAKELNIPVIALSQLNRAADGREGNRPQLSDLRASGDIEQDADVVMFVFREEYYVDRERPTNDSEAYNNWLQKRLAVQNRAEIIIAKHRTGPICTVVVRACPETLVFEDLPQAEGSRQ